MMTRTISVVGGVSLILADGTGISPNLLVLEGYCNGTLNLQYFLQIHNSIPVSGTTVPLRSLQILGQDGYTFNKLDIGLTLANLTNPPANSAIYISLSSTDNVFTAPGITADINADIEEYEIELYNTTTVGDTVTPVITRTVLADAANQTKDLVSLLVTNTYAVAGRVQLFAASPVAGVSIPLVDLAIGASATFNFKFGGNKSLYQQDTNGTGHYGIYVGMSLTPGLFDNMGLGTIQAVIK